MAGVYLDTSALGRILLGEPGHPAILDALEAFEVHVASRLLGVELRRLALRHDRLADAERLLNTIALVPLDESTLAGAERTTPASVATLDAIHLVTAVRLSETGLIEALMTYDGQLATGAREHGITVIAPA